MASNEFIKLPKIPKGSNLPTSAKEWVSFINKRHDAALELRQKYELQAITNLAMYLGYQSLSFFPTTGAVRFTRDEADALVVNRIGAFIESRHSKLTKNRPVPRVIPDTGDRDDKSAARNADHCLMHTWRKINFEREYDRMVMQMLITGTSFIRCIWDPSSPDGDVVTRNRKSEDGQDLIMDEEDGSLEEKIFLGEVSNKVRSFWNILVANDALPDIKDQEWMIDRDQLSLTDVEQLYPHLRGKIKGQPQEKIRTQYEQNVLALAAPVFLRSARVNTSSRDGISDEVLVKMFWMKPNWQLPKGVVAVLVGDELAMIDEWPNEYSKKNIYPYVKFQEKESGFHFYNQSTIERLIPIQMVFNALRRQKAKNAAVMANGKILLAKGSQVIEEALTDEEGEVVEYNPNVPKPEQMVIAPLPNYVTELAKELIIDFRDVGNQSELSVTPPPSITASVAMQTQSELSDQAIAPIIRRCARSLEEVGHIDLMLIDQEYVEKRKIKILGANGAVDVQWMNNMDLKHHTDVHIEVESLYPELRGSKLQKLTEWWDRRIITDPKMFLKAARSGDIDDLIVDEERVEEMIWLDIQKIKKGRQPEIHQYQNHMAYVKALSNFAQTPEFLQLIPERKQLLIAVLQEHLNFLMQSMPAGGEAMAQQNQAAVGTPFGPATPAGAPGGGA